MWAIVRYAVRTVGAPRESSEGALVDEPQFGTAVVEAETGVQVLLVGRSSHLDEQLTAHAQVQQQGVLDRAIGGIGQLQPQVLPAAACASDDATGQSPIR